MNRSVKSLLGASILVPAAALAVAAAPAHAAPPGPSTTLLYETYAAAAPAGRTLPENVTTTAGQSAEQVTLTVDDALESAPVRTGSREAGCFLDPSETIDDRTGTSLPSLPLTTGRKGPASALTGDACLGAGRLADRRPETGVRPGPLGGEGIGGGLPGDVRGPGSDLGLSGADVLPGGRRAGSPLSMGLSRLPSPVAGASPARLPAGDIHFPPARPSRPGPAEDLADQVSGLVGVGEAGTGLDGREEGAGKVVKVLKARERAANPADGPVSLLDSPGLDSSGPGSSGLALPEVPVLG